MSKKEIKRAEEPVTEVMAPVQGEPETVCYIGPTIPGTVQHAAFFRNGLPEHLEKAIEKCPAIKGLLIPISKLASVDNGPMEVLTKAVQEWAGVKEV